MLAVSYFSSLSIIFYFSISTVGLSSNRHCVTQAKVGKPAKISSGLALDRKWFKIGPTPTTWRYARSRWRSRKRRESSFRSTAADQFWIGHRLESKLSTIDAFISHLLIIFNWSTIDGFTSQLSIIFSWSTVDIF